MRHPIRRLLLILIVALPPTANAAETPADPEQALVAELKATPLQGEMVTLNVADKPVFALFLPALGNKQHGALLLLHDVNDNADSLGVIHPLRTRLPELGWSTLSLQLPYAEDGIITPALLDETRKRIAAAITELQRRSNGPVALIGHGLGALAAVDYLAARDNLVVRGLVLISMDGMAQAEPRLDGAAELAKLRPPILDIYGGRDTPAVVDSAARRAEAAERRAGRGAGAALSYSDIARDYTEAKGLKLGFRQLRIAAADHTYSHQEAILVRTVRGWLKRYVAKND